MFKNELPVLISYLIHLHFLSIPVTGGIINSESPASVIGGISASPASECITSRSRSNVRPTNDLDKQNKPNSTKMTTDKGLFNSQAFSSISNRVVLKNNCENGGMPEYLVEDDEMLYDGGKL
ncbi:hypothetical protein DCAR_0520277 [Daucus carota subsp. sativus]|uniref:Uncharacterized protein n=1 Tax=Daucus carota subsp. sativus TaxID=79200 RepID=A0A164YFK4_DAUCS|nr:hypothetical protein DCAR_0520277 [Daucus carota subsp. sativus]